MHSPRYTPVLAALLGLVACGEIKSDDQGTAAGDADVAGEAPIMPAQGGEDSASADDSADADTPAVDEAAEAAAAPEAESATPRSDEAQAEDAASSADDAPSGVVREGDTGSESERRGASAADEPCEVDPVDGTVTEDDPGADERCEVGPDGEGPSEEEAPPEMDPTDAALEPPISEPT